MSKYYKVTKSLTRADSQGEIEFFGCDAEITGEMSSSYFVRFYAGIPYLIGKQTFRDSTVAAKGLTNIGNMIVADITLWKEGSKIKTYRSVLSKDEAEYQSVKENVSKWFKLNEGAHYDSITHEVVEEIKKSTTNNKTEMAKSTAKTGLKDAPKETGLAVFEEQVKGINLPAIPEVMNVYGIEVSKELIRKEVERVKKIKLKGPDDVDTYEILKEEKQRLVKIRTQSEKFGKEISKPFDDYTGAIKGITKSFGTEARPGQEHCEQQIAIYENWKEAKEREEAERVQKLIDQRTVDLQSVAGVINRDSLHWTFPYLPSKLVENSFLEEADDSEWGGLMKELEDAYAADKAKQAKEREEFEQAKNAVYNTRLQMLQLVGGYESPNPGTYTKNGHTLTEEQIRNTPESDWFTLVQSHSTPAAAHNPFGQATGTAPQSSQTTNPFSQPGNILNIAQESVEATGTGASNNPFAKFVKEVEQKPEADENEVQGVDHTVPHTIWDNTFVEKPLGKTTIRIFPTEHVKEGSKLPEGSAIAFDGKWDNGLMFIIYKAAQQ